MTAATPRNTFHRFWRRLLGAASSRVMIGLMALSATGLVGIAGFERYRGTAYLDDVGVPTVGYGTTQGVKLGDKTTPERALVRLLADAGKASTALKSCIKVPLYQHEFDAYVSLAYNIGDSAFCNSTLVRKLNAGDYRGACDQVLRWDYAGGKRLRGLTVRRQAEWRTCVGGQA